MLINETATRAFLWIENILDSHNIPHQVIGGLAAQIYGSTIDLADIDIGVPEHRLAEIFPEIAPYVTFGPSPYRDEDWNIPMLVTLNYRGQEVDLPSADTMFIRNKKTGGWQRFPFSDETSVCMLICGIRTRVIAKHELIAYKTLLGRTVDLCDTKEIADHEHSRTQM